MNEQPDVSPKRYGVAPDVLMDLGWPATMFQVGLIIGARNDEWWDRYALGRDFIALAVAQLGQSAADLHGAGLAEFERGVLRGCELARDPRGGQVKRIAAMARLISQGPMLIGEIGEAMSVSEVQAIRDIRTMEMLGIWPLRRGPSPLGDGEPAIWIEPPWWQGLVRRLIALARRWDEQTPSRGVIVGAPEQLRAELEADL